MIATKACPSCNEDVPTVAKRCKHCFHDFQARPKSSLWAALIALLSAVAVMVVVANLTLFWIVSQPQEQHIQVDQDSRAIVWTRTYVSGTESDRMLFDDVARLEYVLHASGGYEIGAIAKDGGRKIVQASDSPLKTEAQTYARVMGKELVFVDNTRGFGGN